MEPMEVVYEELVEDYRGTVLWLLDGIGISVPENFAVAEPRMRRQADELSEEWVRLYDERAAAKTVQKDKVAGSSEHPLHTLPRHRAVGQAYGYSVRTPNIQRLAEEGVLFRKAFCAAPTCSGSRACLLTGQYAHSNGMVGPRPPRVLAQGLQAAHRPHAARSRVLVGAHRGEHISKKPDIIGYDEVVKISTSHTDDVVPVTLDLLERASDRPFFLSVGFFETHREWFRPSSPRRPTTSFPRPICRTRPRRAWTWPRSRRAPARSTGA